MDQQWPLPDWLCTPGEHALPSGRVVVVEPIEETWICLELGRRLVAVVDLDEEPPLVRLSLQWARDRRLNPPGTRPYHCEATVALVEGGLVVRDLPAGTHKRGCEWSCPIGDASQFETLLAVDDLESCLDVLAGLRRDPFLPREVPESGILLWRGLVDDDGNALVERLPPDEDLWAERPLSVAARIPLDLRSGCPRP